MFHLRYGLNRSLNYLRRNLRAAMNNIIIISSALAMLGVISLLYLNILHLSEIWLSNTSVSLFLDKNMTDERREELLAKVQEHAMVREAKLVTPTEGMNSLAQRLGAELTLFSQAEKDELPYTIDFEIYLDYRRLVGEIAETFAKMPGVEDVVYAERSLEKIRLFFELTKFAGLFFIGLILAAFCLIIANATRLSLHSRRKEIEILHLAGAPNGFIRSAFVVESITLAILGWGLAMLLVWGTFQMMLAGITWDIFTDTIRELSIFFPLPLIAGSLGTVVVLAALSSHLAVNSQLRGLEP